MPLYLPDEIKLQTISNFQDGGISSNQLVTSDKDTLLQ
jgi:hypothetical protein